MQATPYSNDQQADAANDAQEAQLAAARKVCPTAPAAAWYELDFVALEQGGPGGEWLGECGGWWVGGGWRVEGGGWRVEGGGWRHIQYKLLHLRNNLHVNFFQIFPKNSTLKKPEL